MYRANMPSHTAGPAILAGKSVGTATGRGFSIGLTTMMTAHKFEKWAEGEFNIQISFSACKYKAKAMTNKNKAEIVPIFSYNKQIAENAEPNKCTCYTLTYNGKVIYAALCGRDIANNLKKNGENCICEEYHGPANKNEVIGYYALCMHGLKSMPVTHCAKRMNEKFKASSKGMSVI